MKKMSRHMALLAMTLLFAVHASAQDGMEEYFYASGKIKVVVAVAAIVLIGIFAYLFSLERRLKKLEKKK